ncbi:hypothetical protein GQ53DRAFT_876671 [Thozetella sp. PMI_491]|nr:hypothetical protein GQ53DRAFT_876671 [Thozetella sp. PMI_491]
MSDYPAIVGMACRVAGARSPSKLWDNIVAKRDVQKKYPKERFNIDAFYHPDNANKGTTNAIYGYCLEDPLDHFDAEFFGISGKEAEAMDPQQRMLLEVVYEALEDARITLDEISGSNTSVFCGTLGNDYGHLLNKDLEHYPRHTITGQGNALLSNRVSYFYNLHGPSVTLDTACSSSLVTLHMGSSSVLGGESDISIIMGCSAIVTPGLSVVASDMGFLSDDGRCRSFDAAGSGYGRGEGICVVVLKRQSLAIRDNNVIKAIVRATASNHDGKKTGITVPSPEAQETLIRSTYDAAGLDPDGTQYFEAHGTGTKVGDPREAMAIGAVFGTPTRKQPLYVGSVKSNIGHLEGAAGLAAVIKTTTALMKEKIPPNMFFETPNPEIKFEEWKLQVPTMEIDWPTCDIRRASCSSFGYGGANAHVILEGYTSQPSLVTETNGFHYPSDPQMGRPYLLPITSHSQEAGELTRSTLLNYIKTSKGWQAEDLAYSLSFKRSMHRMRSFTIGSDLQSLCAELETPRKSAAWVEAAAEAPRVGLVFTGQGAQSFDMARQLIEQSPLFRSILEKCQRVLDGLPDAPAWSIIGELSKSMEESQLSESSFSQPICTAIQVALTELLRAWGVHPVAVCGHSSGEVAAAFAAGIIPLETAVVIAYHRGIHMPRGQTHGAMMAVGLGKNDVMVELKEFEGKLCIAAVNSQSSVTVSGDEEAITRLSGILSARGIFSHLLRVKQAFHSHHMFPLAPAYQHAMETCDQFYTESISTCRMFSSVTSQVVDREIMRDASYWVQNMLRPVQFANALTGILLDEQENRIVDVLVEIGPHPTLKSPASEITAALKMEIPYFGTLDRRRPAFEALLETAGQLFAIGVNVDLTSANQDQQLIRNKPIPVVYTKLLPDLPKYCWNHKSYWAGTRITKQLMRRAHQHSLIGSIMPGSTHNTVIWRRYLRISELPWLRGHMVDGRMIFPGSGYISLAIEAAARLKDYPTDISQFRLREVDFISPMSLNSSDQGTEVLLEIRPSRLSSRSSSAEWFDFTVSSFNNNDSFAEHCHGLIAVDYGPRQPLTASQVHSYPRELLTRCRGRLADSTPLYTHLERVGLGYSDDFKLLKGSIEIGDDFSMSRLEFEPRRYTPDKLEEHTILHPALLDSSWHLTWLSAHVNTATFSTDLFVPSFVESINISGLLMDPTYLLENNTQTYYSTANARRASQRSTVSTTNIWSPDGTQLLVEAKGLEGAIMEMEKKSSAGKTLFFQKVWRPCFDLLSSSTAPEVFGFYDLVGLFVFQHPSAKILFIASSRDALTRLHERVHSAKLGGPLYKLLHVYMPGVKEEESLAIQESLKVVPCHPDGQYDFIAYAEDAPVPTIMSLSSHIQKSTALVTVYHPGALTDLGMDTVQLGKNFISQQPPHSSNKLELTIIRGSSGRTEDIAACLQDMVSVKCIVPISAFSASQPVQLSTRDVVVLLGTDWDIRTADDWAAVRHILCLEQINLVWITYGAFLECSNPAHAKVAGLLRTARSENPQSRYITLDMEHTATSPQDVAENAIRAFSVLSEEEIAVRDGCAYIPRAEEDMSRNRLLPGGPGNVPSFAAIADAPPVRLTIGKIGLLETLWFEPNTPMINQPLGEDDVEIDVRATAMNFRDVAVAMGLIQDWGLGNECSGVVHAIGSKVDETRFKPGDRVVASLRGAHATRVRINWQVCRKIPDSIDFPVAASFMTVTTTALYALLDLGRLTIGETVLIHSAAGGVGQIAIQLAQRAGAKLLVTCSESKRAFLREKFGLDDSQIFSSRDESFIQGVLAATQGRGVDVVLNSLAENLLQATWRCMAFFGRFIEIGKRDIHQNSRLEMEIFRRNTTFAAVDMVAVFEKHRALANRLIDQACDLVFSGEIRVPDSLLEMPFSAAERAFRQLQLGKHIGKIILVPRLDDMIRLAPLAPTVVDTPLFDAAKIYLLVGGLGGLGSAVAEWMFLSGAMRFAFLGRSGHDQKRQGGDTVEWLRLKGATVQVYKGDVTNIEDVRRTVSDMGSNLGGIMHAAMVLQDAAIRTMTFSQWETCVRVKCEGARNLHEATLAFKLDFFICFSSIATIVGNPGQANYNAANAYLDGLMRWRRSRGLVGVSINIAGVSDVGVLAESKRSLEQSLGRNQLETLTSLEVMWLVREAVHSDRQFLQEPVLSGLCEDLITGLSLQRADGPLTVRATFNTLYANRQAKSANKGENSLVDSLATAASLEERTLVLRHQFINKLGGLLSISAQSVSSGSSLASHGLDSIVALELRWWLKEAAGVDMPLFELLSSQPIDNVIQKAALLFPIAETEKSINDHLYNDVRDTIIEAPTAGGSLDPGPIPPAISSAATPLSHFQERMYNYHQILEEKWRFNLGAVIRFTIDNDRVATEGLLRQTLSHLSGCHAVLKTAFVNNGNFIEQRILKEPIISLSVHDFSRDPDPESALRQVVWDGMHSVLDIAAGQVFRAAGVRLSDSIYAIMLVFHHLVMDDRSIPIIASCWHDTYKALTESKDPAAVVPAPRVTYRDFTVWHNGMLKSDAILSHRKFWKAYLEAVTPCRLLPFAIRPQRPTSFSVDRSKHQLALPASLARRIKRICAQKNVTPFHFTLAVFRAFIYQFTREQDLVICVLDGSRPRAELQALVGYFTNAIPLRIPLRDDRLPFDEFIDQVSLSVLHAMEHSVLPFGEIVESVGANSTPQPGVPLLGQIAINYRKFESKLVSQHSDGVKALQVDIYNTAIEWDFSLEIEETLDGPWNLILDHSLALYKAEDMALFLSRFVAYLSSAIRDHHQKIVELAY